MTPLHRVALVLHTHVPYVRRNGVWPAGEDLFFQAAVESYLPLAGVFARLADDGLRGFCTVGVTPVTAHQMADADMRAGLATYLGQIELRALRQVANYTDRHATEIKELAAFYALRARRQQDRLAAFPGGIAGALRGLADAGAIELLGGPATHPLLPSIASERLRALQLETGLVAHHEIFGRRPGGMWIPECAVAPGVERSLVARGVRYAVVDSAALAEHVGPGGRGGPARAGDTGMIVLPRATAATELVWSPDAGYPTGASYRDFHHSDVVAGFKNWRVTDPAKPLGEKEPYDPAAAVDAARADADAYVAALEREFARGVRDTLVVCFDTELLGHWWFEGPVWLEHVLKMLALHPTMRPVTLGEAAAAAEDAHLPPATLQPSTWGAGSDDRNWRSPETGDIFSRLADAERRAEPHLDAGGVVRDQMLRELLLAQSSDWPYMIARDQNAGYGRQRFETHMERLEALLASLEGGAPADPAAAFAADNCFATLPSPRLA